MTCGIMRLATLQFEIKRKKNIRMGITIFKIFIWGGISSDVRLESTFYGSTRTLPSNVISDRLSDDIPPKMKILNTVIP